MKLYVSAFKGLCAFIILFILKVIGLISMHWFWVLTSWIWAPIMLWLAGLFLIFCFIFIAFVLAILLGK